MFSAEGPLQQYGAKKVILGYGRQIKTGITRLAAQPCNNGIPVNIINRGLRIFLQICIQTVLQGTRRAHLEGLFNFNNTAAAGAYPAEAMQRG